MNNDWHKKGELPHVGDEVEVWVDNVGYWAKVKVLAVDGDKVVWRNGNDGKSYIGTDIGFVRPIQSERDEWYEKGMEVMRKNGTFVFEKQVNALLDAGWRPVKQQSEDEFVEHAIECFPYAMMSTSRWLELYRAGCRFVEVQGE